MRRRFFWWACGFEGGLLGVAWVLAWALSLPLFAGGDRWGRGVLWGVLASLPLVGLFLMALPAKWEPMVEIRQFLDRVVRPVFGSWSVWQLAVVAILAGLGEEALFRGVFQAVLTGWLGPGPGLFLASALFGLAHRMTWSYALSAGAIGAWLGLLFLLTGDLVAPAAAHAFYDFVALVYYLRFFSPKPRGVKL